MDVHYIYQLERLRKAMDRKDCLMAERHLHLMQRESHIHIMENLKEQREYLLSIKKLLEIERNRQKVKLKSYLKVN